MFDSKFFSNNRKRLASSLADQKLTILTAAGLLQRSTDTAYPFRQEGSFWYFTGVLEPDVVLVIDGKQEYLIIPEQSASKEAFDGALNPSELSKISGIKNVFMATEGWRQLGAAIKRHKQFATLLPPPGYIKQIGLYTNPSRQYLIDHVKEIEPSVKITDARTAISRLRMVKQPIEQQAISQAVGITLQALSELELKFKDGHYKNELDIELDLTAIFKRKANGHSFEPIVAAGAKACTIHPQGNNQPLSNRQPVLLDVGCEAQQYAADISRTWNLKPSKRFQAVYDSVKEASDYAKSLLKPGVVMRDYEHKVEKFMGTKLKDLGLISTASSKNIRRYYPHACSHFLGIDVHDVGDYDYPLSSGVVMTVEPGIYIPEEGIGIRIEDDMLITSSGVHDLANGLPSPKS